MWYLHTIVVKNYQIHLHYLVKDYNRASKIYLCLLFYQREIMQHPFKPTFIAALLAAPAPAWADNAAENEGGSAELESIRITARNRSTRTEN